MRAPPPSSTRRSVLPDPVPRANMAYAPRADASVRPAGRSFAGLTRRRNTESGHERTPMPDQVKEAKGYMDARQSRARGPVNSRKAVGPWLSGQSHLGEHAPPRQAPRLAPARVRS